MIPYLIVALTPLVSELFLNSTSVSQEKRKKIIIYISAVAIFVLIGFKSITVGSGDSWTYSKYWAELRNYNFESFINFAKTAY